MGNIVRHAILVTLVTIIIFSCGTTETAVPQNNPGKSSVIQESKQTDQKNVVPDVENDDETALIAPSIHVLTGNSSSIQTLDISRDDRYLLTGDGDTAKLWEIKTGRVIKTFVPSTGSGCKASFSPDEKYVLTYGVKAILWNMETGEEVKSFEVQTFGLWSADFSPDGRFLVTGGNDNKVRVWDVRNSQVLKTFYPTADAKFARNAKSIRKVVFSPDGRYIAASTDYDVAIVWNIESGLELERFNHPGITAVAYSPDGRYIATASWNKTVKLWDVESGREIRSFDHPANLGSAAFSPDGRFIVAGGSNNQTIKIWDVEKGREFKSFQGTSRFGNIAVFSHDGRYVINSDSMTATLREVESGRVIRYFQGLSNSVYLLGISPDGRYFVTGNASDKTANIWDFKSRRLLVNLKGHTQPVTSIAFTPGSRYILTGSDDKSVKLWDAENGRALMSYVGHSDRITSIAVSSDGKAVISGSFDASAKLWDIASGKEIRTFNLYSTQDRNWVKTVAISPDGQYVAAGGGSQAGLQPLLKQWDIKTGREINSYTGHSSYISYAAFSPDGRYLLSGSRDGSAKLWNAASRQELKNYQHDTDLYSAAFSPDGRYIITQTDDDTVHLWNTNSADELISIPVSGLSRVSFLPDGQHIITGSRNGILNYWNIKSGELIYSAANTSDGRNLTWIPEGYFSGDESLAKELVYFVDGFQTIGIEQVYDKLYRPDIIEAAIAEKDIQGLVGSTRIADLLGNDNSPPEVSFITQSGTSLERDKTVTVRITDTGGGVGSVSLFLDGMPVVIKQSSRGLNRLSDSASQSNLASYQFDTTITLRSGTNSIEVMALNKAETIESARAQIELVYQQKVAAKPNLHILAVAVDRYRDRSLWLNYSVNDARSVVQTISDQSKGLFENVSLYELYDGEVTQDSFNTVFEHISPSVKPDDVFLLYLAGHGVTNQSDGDYYYLPSDFRYTGSEAVAASAISKNDILNNLVKIPAQKSVLFFDTCNSGSFIDAPASRGVAEKTAIDRLKRAIGRAIIVASSESQVALEGIENHGVFTYSLLNALNGKADINSNGYITLSEISAYVENDVPDLTYEKWGYEQVPQKQLPKEDFPLVGN